MEIISVQFNKNTCLGKRITMLWSEETCPGTTMTYDEEFNRFIFEEPGIEGKLAIPMAAVHVYYFREDSEEKPVKRGPGRPKKNENAFTF